MILLYEILNKICSTLHMQDVINFMIVMNNDKKNEFIYYKALERKCILISPTYIHKLNSLIYENQNTDIKKLFEFLYILDDVYIGGNYVQAIMFQNLNSDLNPEIEITVNNNHEINLQKISDYINSSLICINNTAITGYKFKFITQNFKNNILITMRDYESVNYFLMSQNMSYLKCCIHKNILYTTYDALYTQKSKTVITKHDRINYHKYKTAKLLGLNFRNSVYFKEKIKHISPYVSSHIAPKKRISKNICGDSYLYWQKRNRSEKNVVAINILDFVIDNLYDIKFCYYVSSVKDKRYIFYNMFKYIIPDNINQFMTDSVQNVEFYMPTYGMLKPHKLTTTVSSKYNMCTLFIYNNTCSTKYIKFIDTINSAILFYNLDKIINCSSTKCSNRRIINSINNNIIKNVKCKYKHLLHLDNAIAISKENKYFSYNVKVNFTIDIHRNRYMLNTNFIID